MKNFVWTAEAKQTLGGLLKEGKTARQIGEHFGVSRSAITGLLARDADLAKIGFAIRGKSRGGGRTKKFTDEEILERKRQYSRAYKAMQRAGAVVIPFPKSSRSLPADSPQMLPRAVRAPRQQLRIVSSNVPLLVRDWLEKNGGPRRFNDRERSDSMAIQQWLADRAITIKATRGNWGNNKGSWSVSRGMGRPKIVTWAEVMEMVDDMRVAEGLQPFSPRPTMEIKRLSIAR